MRLAWKVHRLDVIRRVVSETIDELRARSVRDVMGGSVTWSEELVDGPIRAALDACCDEMRDGCGLPVAGPSGDRGPRVDEPTGSWTERHSLALAKYREAATAALEDSFSRLAAQAVESA